MLDELKEAGYEGSELGDYGYMPTDPVLLREEFQKRGLVLLGAFEGVYLREVSEHAPGEARALRTARLMAALADLDPEWKPLLVLSDEHSRDPYRFHHAGRIRPGEGLSPEEWRVVARGVKRIATSVREAVGLETVFHFHAASFVETPEEIETLVELTGIPLVFDTGHYLFGSGCAGWPPGCGTSISRTWIRGWPRRRAGGDGTTSRPFATASSPSSAGGPSTSGRCSRS
jgi:inosose dehydratase